jgi:hypothetical protein
MSSGAEIDRYPATGVRSAASADAVPATAAAEARNDACPLSPRAFQAPSPLQ